MIHWQTVKGKIMYENLVYDVVVSLWILGLWVFFGCAAMYLAGTKNRSEYIWLVLGLLFGPIAILTIGLAEKKEDKNKEEMKGGTP